MNGVGDWEACKQELLSNIENGESYPWWCNNARFYAAGHSSCGTPLVAKVCWLVDVAIEEHNNLLALRDIDTRFRVPQSFGVVQIDDVEIPAPYGRPRDAKMAVIMEHIRGVPFANVPGHERARYNDSLYALLDAFDAHGLFRPDFKLSDVLCVPDGVVMVDAHWIEPAVKGCSMRRAYEKYLT